MNRISVLEYINCMCYITPSLPSPPPSSTPAQSVFTFLYITLLSHMGERLAVRLRTALFRSLVEQDMVFFDSHKSGELVSR